MIGATELMSSRIVWRTLFAITIVLLLTRLPRSAQTRLRDFPYWSSGFNTTPLNSTESTKSTSEPYADAVDWSQYAYCQYVTNKDYLCNSLMIFEALERLNAKAERLMMYPEHWTVANDTRIGELLIKARDEYRVRLQPIEVQHFDGDTTWAESFTKLLVFNQTRYKRVLSLDSDSTILQPMDELFTLPSATVAMPRAYWLDDTLSSQLVLVEPSNFEFERVQKAFASRGESDFDMEIFNDLYGDDCLVLPHRRYDLITGEFRAKPDAHFRYLGSKEEPWDPDRVLGEAKFLHFSDWPVDKPWLPWSSDVVQANMPKCVAGGNGTNDCRDQELWFGFYKDFRERRARVCGIEVG